MLKDYEEECKATGIKEQTLPIQITKFKKQILPFLKNAKYTSLLIKAASRRYKFPIIVLSSSNMRAFFDR
jgi:hypothetical protein